MKLRNVSAWFALVVPLAVGLNGLSVLLINQAYKHVEQAQEHRRLAMALALDLRHETERLTSLVRAYASTGESRYLLYYYDIVAIREGKKPMPEQYDLANYWEEVIAGHRRHQLPASGVQRSMVERMRSIGFGAMEFKALQKVVAIYFDLNKIEQIAFAATQGLYDPERGEFVSDGRPHLEFASQLVHGKEYNMLKAELARAVEHLAKTTDTRTSLAADEATRWLEQLILLSFATMVAAFLLVAVATQIIRERVLQPIQHLNRAADRLAAGNYATRVDDVSRGVDELVALGRTFDSMAHSIEDDIRQQYAAQLEIEKARQQAEDATRAKSMFLANMSHEIRTPMNAVIGLSYLALKTALSAKQQDYVEKIHQAGTSLLGIIDDILDFSKIEAGKLDIEQTGFVLDKVTRNVAAVISHKAIEKGIELVFDIPHDVPQDLIGDPLRLGQILTNLVNNAVKFTQHGEVTIRIGVIEKTDDRVQFQFSVRDTGIGLTQEQRARLFQAFTQADGSTTRRYGGTGLGLTICKHLVELMGGRIWAESEYGAGSTFSFTTWLGLGQAVGERVLPDYNKGLRVLIVDDNSVARSVLASHCIDFGLSADEVPSGEQAIVAVREAAHEGHPYGLILMDWLMPGMTGLRAAQAIKADAVPGQVPVVVMVTAYGVDEARSEVDDFPVEGYLVKPVMASALFDMLIHLHSENPEINPSRVADSGKRYEVAGMRVLLVEDNPINQQIATELMTEKGIIVEVADNGRIAVDKLKAGSRCDVVLMDLQMPEMDGYAASAAIRSDPARKALPILAMTAHATAEERRRCLDAQMNDHITKPIDPDALFSALAQWGGRRTWEPQERPPPVARSQKAPAFTIEGVDTANGLRRVAGNSDLYRKLLQQFAAGHADDGANVRAAIAAGDRAAAERVAHSMKGVAGNVGASALAEVAGQLEQAIHAGQEGEALLTSFSEKVDATIAALQKVLQDLPEVSAAAPAMAVAPREALALLRRLGALLSNGEAEAADFFAAHQAQLHLALGADANGVERAIRDFDYEIAAKQVRAVVARHSTPGTPPDLKGA